MDKNPKRAVEGANSSMENGIYFNLYRHDVFDSIQYNAYVYLDKDMQVSDAQQESLILNKNDNNYNILLELLDSVSYSNYLIAKAIIENENKLASIIW